MSKESVEVMLARIDENVIALRGSVAETRQSLDMHIEEDKRTAHEFLRPLWEAHQQGIGAAKTRGMGGVIADKAATIIVAIVGAWAALRGFK